MKLRWSFFLPAALWLFISTVLLCLPGASFPKEDWLDKIWMDKWVHIGLFFLMVFLWCRFVHNAYSYLNNMMRAFIIITGIATIYGIGMEFVQLYWIPNRSFDPGDIVADTVGALAGLFYSWYRYIKK